MAPFRSSRSTRNTDAAAANRGRGGVVDHDPTEGLPVRNWYLGNVNIKQDESNTNDDDQQANVNTSNPDYPWSEQRLPSYFSELPIVSQQLIRAARSGRSVKPSVYDKRTETYVPHAEYAARNVLKSKHLENVDSPVANEDEDMDEGGVAKNGGELEEKERIFTMKKWSQVPPAVAEKRPEPKYLADRRPGMRSLYGNYGVATAALNPVSGDTVAATASYDLGDGSGLGNASGVLAAGAPNPDSTTAVAAPLPAIRRMPPKRKKKKIGGPGRKKANHGPGPERMTTSGPSGSGDGTAENEHGDIAAGGDRPDTANSAADVNGDEDGDEDGSGSEEEGSEEGEIDEGQEEVPAVNVPATEPAAEASAAPVAMILEEEAPVTATAEPEVAQAPVEESKAIPSPVEVVEEVAVSPAPEVVDETSAEAKVLEILEPEVPDIADNDLISDEEMKEEPQQEEKKEKVDLLGTLDGAIAGMENGEN